MTGNSLMLQLTKQQQQQLESVLPCIDNWTLGLGHILEYCSIEPRAGKLLRKKLGF